MLTLCTPTALAIATIIRPGSQSYARPCRALRKEVASLCEQASVNCNVPLGPSKASADDRNGFYPSVAYVAVDIECSTGPSVTL